MPDRKNSKDHLELELRELKINGSFLEKMISQRAFVSQEMEVKLMRMKLEVILINFLSSHLDNLN